MLGGLVAAHVAVAVVLVVLPLPDDLSGWDVGRFAAIADQPGRPWRDVDVEYPPGTLLLTEALGAPAAAVLNDRLAVLGLACVLAIAVALGRIAGRRATVGWLAASLLLLPRALQGYDLVTALAVVLAVGAARRRPAVAGVLLAVGALVKTWPAVVLPAFWAARHRRAVVVAGAVGAVAAVAWVAYAGLDGPRQVLTFRGATGWHVESVPGTVLAFAGDAARYEAGSYRVGSIDPVLRFGLLAAFGAVALAMVRRPRRLAVGALTLAAALLVTSPLLSPQFLGWLVPLAVLAWLDGDRTPAGLTIAAAGMTTAVFAAWSPPELDSMAPAAALTFRNALLIAVVIAGLRTNTSGSSAVTVTAKASGLVPAS